MTDQASTPRGSTVTDLDALAEDFRVAQLNFADELTERHPEASRRLTRFRPAVADRSGPQAVQFSGDLILRSEATVGFKRMCRDGLGEWTLEHMVLRSQWRPLFTDRPQVLEIAEWRLFEHGVASPTGSATPESG